MAAAASNGVREEEPAAKKRCVGSVVNMAEWIAENEAQFLPPVCNKLMHGAGQLKIMFVGGPNVRADYHINNGEELFYMVRGDMVLKIMEHGVPKDVPIKEGEIFILPGCIPHSPQRQANTVGLVIERERCDEETDGLRYYRPAAPTEPLYEEWFHCFDLGVQLKPVIERWFASEQHRTGEVVPGTLANPVPVKLDTDTTVHTPFRVDKWLAENSKALNAGSVSMFSDGEFKVEAVTSHSAVSKQVVKQGEAWLWQFNGTSNANVAGESMALEAADSLLLTEGQEWEWEQSEGGVGFVIIMVPFASASA